MTKSRGIRHIERHGLCPRGVPMTPEYRAWKAAIERCENPKCKYYKNYGGRGVAFCAEWRQSFTAFLAAVGPRPSRAHSLDRIKNELGYEPGNVRWATRREQNRNRRGLKMITWRGETLCLQEWSERVGISDHTIRTRLQRGWPIDRALTEAA